MKLFAILVILMGTTAKANQCIDTLNVFHNNTTSGMKRLKNRPTLRKAITSCLTSEVIYHFSARGLVCTTPEDAVRGYKFLATNHKTVILGMSYHCFAKFREHLGGI